MTQLFNSEHDRVYFVYVCACVSGLEAVPGACVSSEVDVLMDQSPSDFGDLRLGNVSFGCDCKQSVLTCSKSFFFLTFS